MEANELRMYYADNELICFEDTCLHNIHFDDWGFTLNDLTKAIEQHIKDYHNGKS